MHSVVGVDGQAGVPISEDETSITTSERDELNSAARAYMHSCGLKPTPDAVDQLVEVFLPCLRIMCDRPWDPEGGTWRRSGMMGILTDIRKKFERLWYRGWIRGQRHDDSAFDLINYVGFYLRSGESQWGDWGDPGHGKEYQ